MAVASCESCGKSGAETEKTEKIEDTGLINQRVYRYCTVSGKTPASSVARRRGLCFTVRSCTMVLLGSKPKLAGRSHDNHRIRYFLTELCVSVNKNLSLTHIFFCFCTSAKGSHSKFPV